MQVSDLELAHKLIHSISIEKLLVTHYADLASALLPRFDLLRLDRRSIRLNRVWPLFVEALIATEFSTEMAVFQLPLLRVTAAIASGPFLDHLALIFRDSPLEHEYRVIDVEHDMYLFIDFDLQGLRTKFIVLLRKLIPLRFGQVFEMLEFRVAWTESD